MRRSVILGACVGLLLVAAVFCVDFYREDRFEPEFTPEEDVDVVEWSPKAHRTNVDCWAQCGCALGDDECWSKCVCDYNCWDECYSLYRCEDDDEECWSNCPCSADGRYTCNEEQQNVEEIEDQTLTASSMGTESRYQEQNDDSDVASDLIPNHGQYSSETGETSSYDDLPIEQPEEGSYLTSDACDVLDVAGASSSGDIHTSGNKVVDQVQERVEHVYEEVREEASSLWQRLRQRVAGWLGH